MAKARQSSAARTQQANGPVDPRLARVQRICERRAFRERDVSIGRIVGEIGRQARRDADRAGRAAEAWRAVMPAALADEAWIEQSSSVQITVGVASAPAAFALDRALRSGALAELRRLLQSPGLRVRTRIGPPPAP